MLLLRIDAGSDLRYTVGMSTPRIAINPRATPAQIARLAKKDLPAALQHPNAPLSFLLSHPDRLDVILANPAWSLHCLSEPDLTYRFLTEAQLNLLRNKIKNLVSEMRYTCAERKRVIAWAVECAGGAVALYRGDWRTTSRFPAAARREALRYVAGLAFPSFPPPPSPVPMDGGTRQRIGYARGASEAVWSAAYAASRVETAPDDAKAQIEARSAANCADLAASAASKAYLDLGQRVAIVTRQYQRLKEHVAGKVPWVERVLAKQRREERVTHARQQ